MNPTYSLLFILFLVVCACNPVDPEKAKQEMIQADIAFSDLSVAEGANKAFLTFMDENVVTLQDNRMPIISKDDHEEVFNNRDDSAFTLTWEPEFAQVSTSGDLGYTYGQYELTVADSVFREGYYVTIWKKDANGNWKFVLDTGTEGFGN